MKIALPVGEVPETTTAAVISVETSRCRILPDGRMTRRDAAAYLGFSEKTLAMWALQGKGPKSIKIAGRRFYYQSDLDAFAGRPAATNRDVIPATATSASRASR